VFALDLLEDMGKVAAATFEERAALIYLKTVLRASAKVVTSGVLSSVLTEDDDKKKERSPAAVFLQFLFNQLLNATEAADLRMARYFPGQALVGGVNLPPGTYPVTAVFYDGAGRVVAAQSVDVTVRAGGLNLVEVACLR
jgi:hypothetical protein